MARALHLRTIVNVEPLNRSADRATLDRLLEAGVLAPEAHEEARRWIEPRQDWWTWSSRSLLFIGAALVLSGIVFFFAYNWSAMGPFLKLGLAEGAVVAALAGVAWKGLDRLGGKVFLFAASFLVGVFLAVFGQVYQTGADAWELFAGWAALTAGWVLVSRFAALWILWIAVLNVGVMLYREQMFPSYGAPEATATMFLALAGIDLAALVGVELGTARKRAWVQKRWTRPLLWGASLFALTSPVLPMICSRAFATIPAVFSLVGLLAVGMAGSFYFFRRSPDLSALTMIAFSACSMIITAIGKAVFMGSCDAGAFLLMALVTLGVFAGAAIGLRAVARRMKEAAHA